MDPILGATLVTSEMVQSVVTTVTDNATVILPAGMTLLGISLGISWIPKIIKKFR